MAAHRLSSELIVKRSDFITGERLGNGTYGIVYRAEDRRTGKIFALKEMNSTMLHEENKKFLDRELEILATFNHPALLSLSGYVPLNAETGEPPMIVTEYMSGGSLEKILALVHEGTPPDGWDSTRRHMILYGIACGMATLHRYYVIHRDLKPDNIMLTEAYEPKIGDFGLSKFVAPDDMLNQSGTRGAARYMAPEIHESFEYGFEVDVYAYGMIMYEVITGQIPFTKNESLLSIGRKVLSGMRPSFPEQISLHHRQLIEHCWAQEPADRLTFDAIVARLASTDFVDSSIDCSAFRAYQQHVAPL
jgi:serine/threonine protein kinase